MTGGTLTDYQIRVKGQLDPQLAVWFGDFIITHTSSGDTLLTGRIIDQAHLHGVLSRFRNLGMTLVAMYPLPDDDKENTSEQNGPR